MSRRLLLSTILFLLLIALPIAARTAPFAFKGLAMGMTRQQVDSLIRHSPWGHRDWPGDTSKDIWTLAQDGIAEVNEFSAFGCEFIVQRSECPYMEGARIEFQNNVVVHMRIQGGPIVGDTTIAVSIFGLAAEEMIRNLYGPPTATHGTFGNLPKHGIPSALWELSAEEGEPTYVIRVTPTFIDVTDRSYRGRVTR